MKTKLTHRILLGIVAVVLGCTLVILSMATLVAADPGTPTVNGRFYGDGDEANYEVLGSAAGNRGTLYYTQTGSTLYLAVVVSNTVNDNVFGDTGDISDTLYLKSAGWKGTGNQHEAKHLYNSDHVSLTLKCGANSWEWAQGYLYDADNDKDPGEADWLSGPGDPDGGGGTPPTALISSTSSLQWNLNNAATYSDTAWDVTLNGQQSDFTDWKSPDDVEWPKSDNNVTNNGYSAAVTPPWYDSAHQWEWAMVYELSIDISSACGDIPWSVDVLGAHNSPPKDGIPDIVIELGNIGDYVWVDDGSTAGLQGETYPYSDTGGINGVELELWLDVDADDTFSETADSLVKTMTTITNTDTGEGGWYLFTNLSPGTYFVRIAPQEFDSGGTLYTYGPTVPNAYTDTVDSDGDNPTCPYSPTIRTGECGQIGFENNILAQTTLTRDADGHVADDLTIDFGVVLQGPPTAVTLSSFAARPSIDDSRRWLWMGLAGVTVVVAGSLFRAKRRHS